MMTLPPAASTGSLNVVALISGGKDSIFSLLHCLANNHKVVALANLYPAGQGSDSFTTLEGIGTNSDWDRDVDSFMYQTAGHNLIPLFSDALGLPLYRQEITGGARDSSLSYSGQDERDETEALVPLLNRVKRAHPEVNAVSSGAILSTYQRTRVESVAIRLGMIPLSYLWQYPSLPPPSPSGLLEDMGKAGFDIRIIKVASGGLSKALLWCNLASSQTQRKLERAVRRFGGSVLGEGGEYETMVVSGPSNLLVVENSDNEQNPDAKYPIRGVKTVNQFWKGRIDVSDEEYFTLEEPGSDTATLLFRHKSGRISHQSPADANMGNSDGIRPILKVPNAWDKHFDKLLKEACRENPLALSDTAEIHVKEIRGAVQLTSAMKEFSEKEQKLSSQDEWDSSHVLSQAEIESHPEEVHDSRSRSVSEAQTTLARLKLENFIYTSQVDDLFVVANLTGLSRGDTSQQQMRAIKQDLLAILDEIKRPTSSIIFTTMLLTSISDFATINQIYGELFEHPNPPARVTIACPLPHGIELMVSVVINMGPRTDALHVQSRSYWAPANIGPYSQAVRMPSHGTLQPSLVFIAGQIPLMPATMELLGSPAVPDKEPPSISSPLHDLFLRRSCLSLQHLWRIGREMKVGWWTGGIAFITGGVAGQSKRAALAWTIWQKAHACGLWKDPKDDDDDNDNDQIDVWDMKYRGMGTPLTKVDEEHCLPDFDRVKSTLQGVSALLCDKITDTYHFQTVDLSETPGFFAVEVNELPRGSDIEWQGLGIAQSDVTSLKTTTFDGETLLEVKSCVIGSTKTCVAFVNVWRNDASSQETLVSRSISRALDWVRNVSAPASDSLITIYTPDVTSAIAKFGTHVVPCHAVWGSGGRQLVAGIVAQFKIGHGMEG